MKECAKCGKPTRSHEIGDSVLCHTCWLKMSEEERKQFEDRENRSKVEKAVELARLMKMVKLQEKKMKGGI